MFMIPNQDELMTFIKQNDNKDSIGWTVRDNRVHFTKGTESRKEIPSTKMIALSLEYATDINRII